MKHNSETLEIMQTALAQLNSAYNLAMNAYGNFTKAKASFTSKRIWLISQLMYAEIERIKGYDND